MELLAFWGALAEEFPKSNWQRCWVHKTANILDKLPKKVQLQKDKDHLFTFYDYPAIHWQHIRTTNPIESTFATIRHRTRQTKGCGSRMAALTMVYTLSEGAEKSWKRLKGYELISKIVSGVKFEDGNEIVEKAA